MAGYLSEALRHLREWEEKWDNLTDPNWVIQNALFNHAVRAQYNIETREHTYWYPNGSKMTASEIKAKYPLRLRKQNSYAAVR